MRIYASIALLIVATVATPPARGAEYVCSPIDLRDPGKSMEHVPVRNQQDIGDCYAQAAVQMVDAWRFSHGDTRYNHLTSALEAAAGMRATHAHYYDVEHPLNGGTICDTIDYLRSAGSCDERAVYRDYDLYASLSPDHYVRQLGKYYQDWTADGAIQVSSCLKNDLGMPEKFLPSTEAITKLLDQDNPEIFIEGIIGSHCGENQIPLSSVPACSPPESPAKKNTPQEISALLHRPNAQPIGISYWSGFLQKGGSYSMHDRPHGSLIIGQRKRGDQCQYLIRNSYGPGKDGYSPDWEADGGDIWVDADVVAKNLIQFTTLAPDLGSSQSRKPSPK